MAILLATPSASFADATLTPKPKPKPTSASKPASKPTPAPRSMSMSTPDFEEAINQYKMTREKITQKFFAKVNKANRIAITAMQSAKTVDAKSVALAQQKSSVGLAALARDAAITAMGPAPLEPGEIAPMKKEKPDKPK